MTSRFPDTVFYRRRGSGPRFEAAECLCVDLSDLFRLTVSLMEVESDFMACRSCSFADGRAYKLCVVGHNNPSVAAVNIRRCSARVYLRWALFVFNFAVLCRLFINLLALAVFSATARHRACALRRRGLGNIRTRLNRKGARRLWFSSCFQHAEIDSVR
jgi:hypothetical protein